MINNSEKTEIQKQANFLREDIGLSSGEIAKDIPKMIEEIGYSYKEADLGFGYSGSSRCLPGLKFEICFNTNHLSWGDFYKRFTLAHELGHVRIPSHIEILKNTPLHRSKADSCSTEKIEKEADYFAISFLAPKLQFVNQMGSENFSTQTITNLSNYFGISSHSALFRYLELTKGIYSAIIVNRADKKIEYERRSEIFPKIIGYRYRDLLDDYDMVNFNDVKRMQLNEWYPDLNNDIEADVSILDLGYKDKIAILIEPLDDELENYLLEEERDCN